MDDQLLNLSSPSSSPVVKRKARGKGKAKKEVVPKGDKPVAKRGRPKKIRPVKEESSKSVEVPAKKRRTKKEGVVKKMVNVKSEIGGVVVTHVSSMPIDVDELIADETMNPEELIGFEDVEVFNCLVGDHRLDRIQEPDTLCPRSVLPPVTTARQFNELNLNINGKYQVRIGEIKEDHPNASSLFYSA